MCSWGLGVQVKRDVESYIQGTRGCKKKKLKGPRFLWIHSISKEVQERKWGGLSWYILHEFLMDTWYTLHSIGFSTIKGLWDAIVYGRSLLWVDGCLSCCTVLRVLNIVMLYMAG